MKNAFSLLISFFISALVFANSEEEVLTINYTKSDISCFGKQDGKIELSISGGKVPYIVEWNNGATDLTLENLNKGTYEVTVRDNSGQEQVELISIVSPSPLAIEYNSQRETFLDAYSGTMNAVISGGTPLMSEDKPFYAVFLNDAFGVENGYLMQDGIYKLKIVDSKGCSLSVKVNLDVEIIDSNRRSQSLKLVSKEPNNGLGYIQMSIYPTKALNQLVSNMEIIER